MEAQDLKYDNVFQELLVHIPEFKPLYDEHVDSNDEVLPHVLMGDFTRFVIDAYQKSKAGAGDSEHYHNVVTKSLEFMACAMSSPDLDVQELVSVSFLENLDQAQEDYEGIKALLAPNLRQELAAYESQS